MKTILATAIIAISALFAVGWITEGFRVVTSESARRLAVAEDPPLMPNVGIQDLRSSGVLHEMLADDGRVTLVDFIYTRCESFCTALGSDYQQLQREIVAHGLQERVRLLSVTFDPSHDTPEVLMKYAGRMRADPGVWSFATAADQKDLALLLDAFGIVVIPDGMGGFVHNAAIHVVSPDGRLRQIRDLGQWRSSLHDATQAAAE